MRGLSIEIESILDGRFGESSSKKNKIRHIQAST